MEEEAGTRPLEMGAAPLRPVDALLGVPLIKGAPSQAAGLQPGLDRDGRNEAGCSAECPALGHPRWNSGCSLGQTCRTQVLPLHPAKNLV